MRFEPRTSWGVLLIRFESRLSWFKVQNIINASGSLSLLVLFFFSFRFAKEDYNSSQYLHKHQIHCYMGRITLEICSLCIGSYACLAYLMGFLMQAPSTPSKFTFVRIHRKGVFHFPSYACNLPWRIRRRIHSFNKQATIMSVSRDFFPSRLPTANAQCARCKALASERNGE